MARQNIGTARTEIATEAARLDAVDTGLAGRITNLENSAGAVLVAKTKSAMSDTSKIYVYTGSESGMTRGNWYYHNGSAWVSGGAYNQNLDAIDATLTQSNKGADAKVTGDRLTAAETSISTLRGTIANEYASQAYAIGDYCYHNGLLYRCNTEISVGETWTSGHWTAVDVMPELNNLKSDSIKTYGSQSTISNDRIGYISDSGNFVPNDSWRSLLIEAPLVVTNGVITLISGTLTRYQSTISSVAFFDKDMQFLSGIKATYDSPPTDIGPYVIPDNVSFIAFNSYGENGFSLAFNSFYSQSRKATSEIKTAMATKADVFGSQSSVSNSLFGYIGKDGELHAVSPWRSLMIDARLVTIDGMIRLIQGSLQPYEDYICSIAFFDANKTFLSGSENSQYAPTVFRSFSIPSGTAFIAFNSYGEDFSVAFNSFYTQFASRISAYDKYHIKEAQIDGTGNWQYTYCPIFVRKGDIVTVQVRWSGNAPSLYYSDGEVHAAGVTYEQIDSNLFNTTFVADNTWAGFSAIQASGAGENSYSFYISVFSLVPASEYKSTIFLAASDSTDDDKRVADYICDGTDDQVEINRAIRLAKAMGASYVELAPGNYYIDGYRSVNIYRTAIKAAIVFQHVYDKNAVTLMGPGDGKPRKANINVRSSFFDGLAEDDIPSIITGGPANGNGYEGGQGFNLSNLNIYLPDTTHPCVAINYQWSYWGMVKNCNVYATGFGLNVVPAENSVGIRGWAGWSDGTDIGIEDTYVSGFYVAFQMGGEHAVLLRCGARYNYFGWTFGEYPTPAHSGAQVHPITLINCCDEGSAALPRFFKSGDSDEPADGRCAVDMISFNIEDHALLSEQGIPIIRAMEDTDGGWVGRIDYTICSNQIQNTSARGFWADGHGKNFRTTNSAHKEIGTTALRRSYAPNYMQKFYDENLGKVVFCIDPATKKWVDVNGNDVDA